MAKQKMDSTLNRTLTISQHDTRNTTTLLPVLSARWSGAGAVLAAAAELCGCDVSLFAGPLNSGPGDAAANERCCLQLVNVVAYCCCSLCCIH